MIPTERPAYFDEPSPSLDNGSNESSHEDTKLVEESYPIEMQQPEDNVELRKKDNEEVFKRPTTAERRKVRFRSVTCTLFSVLLN